MLVKTTIKLQNVDIVAASVSLQTVVLFGGEAQRLFPTADL